VTDDWESPEHMIPAPVPRPWANAALFCGAVALGLEAALFVLAVPSLVTVFSGGPGRLMDMLAQLILFASVGLAVAGVGCGLVSVVRREAVMLSAVGVALSFIALWPLWAVR
jgi:hypothetical protein